MKPKAALAGMCLLLVSCRNHHTYAEGCGPLPRGWITPRQGRSVLSLFNVISVRDDSLIEWDGKPISEATLQAYLKVTSGMNPVPVTQIKFAPTTDCQTVRRLRGLMSSNLDCTVGKCAEGAGKWWLVGDVVWRGHPPEPYDPDAPGPPGRKQ